MKILNFITILGLIHSGAAQSTELLGTITIRQRNVPFLDTDFTDSFVHPEEKVPSYDRGTAMAVVTFAAALDRIAQMAEKFDEIPAYRINHVVNFLISQNKETPTESPDTVYDRLITNWKKSCEVIKEKDKTRPCKFVFRFEKSDWTTPTPNFSEPVTKEEIDNVTESFIVSRYPEITSIVKKARETGKLTLDGQTSPVDVTKETEEQTTSKVTQVYQRGYMKGLYSFTQIGTFRAIPVPSAHRQFQWDDISLQTENAPTNLVAFRRIIKERLSAEYHERTRSQIATMMLYGKLGDSGTYPNLGYQNKALVNQELIQRSAQFGYIRVPIAGLKKEEIKALIQPILDAGQKDILPNSVNILEKFDSLVSLMKNKNPSLVINNSQRDYSAEFSSFFKQDAVKDDLTLYARLFRRELSGQKTEELNGKEHTYYIDQTSGEMVFVMMLTESKPVKTPLNLSDLRVDKTYVMTTASNILIRDTFKKVMRDWFKETFIELRRPKLIFGDAPAVNTSSTIDMADYLIKSVETKMTELEKTMSPEKAWESFMDKVYASPIRPKDMRKLP